MKIAIVGLWHTGTVTAACLASKGIPVLAYDDSAEVIDGLRRGKLPVFEPRLSELVRQGLDSGKLVLTDNARMLGDVDVVWVTYDTPVNEQDEADIETVFQRTTTNLSHTASDAFVLISSQLPVGSTRKIAGRLGLKSFGYSPENLRLGNAIDSFFKPSRIVVGLASPNDQKRIAPILQCVTSQIEWMSVESAEMMKHALNAYLATSVAFTNEIAVLSEHVGADVREVERGLRGDPRVGPKAYVRAGEAFAGGTLGRDLRYLMKLGNSQEGLFSAVRASNEKHKQWPVKKVQAVLGNLQGKTIALLGLTYKVGTSTLRRSAAIEMAVWLKRQEAIVHAFDPMVTALPTELCETILLQRSLEGALRGASAMIVANECPEFLSLQGENLTAWMKDGIVIDAGRFLEKNLGTHPRIRYYAVGRPS